MPEISTQQAHKLADEAVETALEKRDRRDLRNQNEELKTENGKQASTIRRLTEHVNVPQLALGVGVGVGTAMGGFKVNRWARESLTKDWVDDQGERTTGAMIVADVLPPLVGVAVAGIGGYALRKNGVAAAATIGAGAGFATGSLISTILVG